RVSPTLLDPSRRTIRSGQSDQGQIRRCSDSPADRLAICACLGTPVASIPYTRWHLQINGSLTHQMLWVYLAKGVSGGFSQ
ncbi:hypothetical protein ABTW96_32510, partial [Nocardia beijingensis]|uniref:hypothetical protein n=1 Tax=Nocardia beijingensis TaxID=95162 RepID=UPI00332DE6A8